MNSSRPDAVSLGSFGERHLADDKLLRVQEAVPNQNLDSDY